MKNKNIKVRHLDGIFTSPRTFCEYFGIAEEQYEKVTGSTFQDWEDGLTCCEWGAYEALCEECLDTEFNKKHIVIFDGTQDAYVVYEITVLDDSEKEGE